MLYHGNNIEELRAATLSVLKVFAGSLYVNNLQMAQERGSAQLLEANIERQCNILKDLELSNDCNATTKNIFSLRNASIISVVPCLSASGTTTEGRTSPLLMLSLNGMISPNSLNIILKRRISESNTTAMRKFFNVFRQTERLFFSIKTKARMHKVEKI